MMNPGNYLFEFNHLRKHGGLNYETPFDKLQKVTELVSMNNGSLFLNKENRQAVPFIYILDPMMTKM